jgi:hypothetical protein
VVPEPFTEEQAKLLQKHGFQPGVVYVRLVELLEERASVRRLTKLLEASNLLAKERETQIAELRREILRLKGEKEMQR